jgi:uncharacterized spore protein YtfJ
VRAIESLHDPQRFAFPPNESYPQIAPNFIQGVLDMQLQDVLKSISDRVETSANVRTVFGDPVTAQGKTIIPVARVKYGFGGGGGWGRSASENGAARPADQGGGGGGGGGVDVRPIGMIEITAGETRYISFEEKRRAARLILVGMVLGFLLMRRLIGRRRR